MLKLVGNAIHSGGVGPYRGIVTTQNEMPLPARHRYVLLTDQIPTSPAPFGYQAIICKGIPLDFMYSSSVPVVRFEPWMDHLTDGDVVSGDPTRNRLRVLYRVRANSNTFLLTERCNSNCIMCSQPPKPGDDSFLVDDLLETIPLLPREPIEIGLSGGEPLLLGADFIRILRSIKANLPQAGVHVLTNGRLLSYVRYAQHISDVGIADLMLGIPVYADLAHVHDFVVQAKGAFDQTIRGLLNAKRCGLRTEIRIVLHRETMSRLTNFASFVVRNLPFVDQIAFMGMENTGYGKLSERAIAVDIANYHEELARAVFTCDQAGLHVSIYNLQLCVLPESLRRFAVRSISDWKNDYASECMSCSARQLCAGFFSWNLDNKSRLIRALSAQEAEPLWT